MDYISDEKVGKYEREIYKYWDRIRNQHVNSFIIMDANIQGVLG